MNCWLCKKKLGKFYKTVNLNGEDIHMHYLCFFRYLGVEGESK